MLIPLALLWITSWGIGRIVIWIAAGFRRLRSRLVGALNATFQHVRHVQLAPDLP
jgi:hypothetical protein